LRRVLRQRSENSTAEGSWISPVLSIGVRSGGASIVSAGQAADGVLYCVSPGINNPEPGTSDGWGLPAAPCGFVDEQAPFGQVRAGQRTALGSQSKEPRKSRTIGFLPSRRSMPRPDHPQHSPQILLSCIRGFLDFWTTLHRLAVPFSIASQAGHHGCLAGFCLSRPLETATGVLARK
jgi:hypothetical protein